MQQVVLNEYEKIASNDINNLQLALWQALTEEFLYNYFQQTSGVVGASFLMSYTSAYVGSLAAGVGFYYDSSQTGFNTTYRMILAASAIAVPFTTADPSHNRIDLVSLAPNFAVTATASRYVKAGGTGPVAAQVVNKLMADGYTLTVTAGTPSSSPVAPSLPAGNIEIAQVLITAATGMTGSGAITDERTILNPALTVQANQVVSTNTNQIIATGTNVQTVIEELDNAAQKEVAFNPGSQSPYTLSTTLLTGDCGKIFLVNSANGASTFNLPNPSGKANFYFYISDIAGNFNVDNVTLHRYASENIMGVTADYAFQAPFGFWMVWTDGTNWFIGA